MILVLTGPTGSGKSKLAVSLAKKMNGAVVNADAYQVYQGLNIATAKPSESMRLEVPHYLFDFVPLSSDYNVVEYQADLRGEISELEGAGKTIIIAGGTGLYLKAGLYDYEFPEERQIDLSSYETLDNKSLYQKALELDEASAKEIHPNNRRRVLRLIQYCLATGSKRSSVNACQTHKPLYDVRFYGLEVERERLYPLVEERVEEMFASGIEEENRTLVDRYGRSCHAFQAIGVKEFFPYWDGQANLEETKELIKKNTRHYVKKQMTWFRHQFPIRWIKGEEDLLADLISQDGLLSSPKNKDN
ncbi:MAG TPA: tRNA (adenosine(37)-N6)-dimethylallyltransferase MiaA [Firmicutes bacterium]|nr:tRNA (adenosine(37)-N6)-dimethylallyltransferase MiaA [Bacillota bacterium]